MDTIGVKVKVVEPRSIATDFFGGRSFDFADDESMAEYLGVVQALLVAMEGLMGQAAPARRAADVIYGAATDGTSQLRYLAGEDAEVILGQRWCGRCRCDTDPRRQGSVRASIRWSTKPVLVTLTRDQECRLFDHGARVANRA